MEAENQKKREIIQPLVDKENGFVKVRFSEKKSYPLNLCVLVLSDRMQLCSFEGAGEFPETA